MCVYVYMWFKLFEYVGKVLMAHQSLDGSPKHWFSLSSVEFLQQTGVALEVKNDV